MLRSLYELMQCHAQNIGLVQFEAWGDGEFLFDDLASLFKYLLIISTQTDRTRIITYGREIDIGHALNLLLCRNLVKVYRAFRRDSAAPSGFRVVGTPLNP